MAGPSWLVNKITIATKIKCAGATQKVTLESNPTIACPNCQYVIDNSDVSQEWPGLPKGVKFDPSDQEIIWHLLAKVGEGNSKPHPFIDAFIITIKVNNGICYTHPQHLPGVSQDGIVSHFFHRAVNAYNTGRRKRRKVCGQDFGDLRWHKTGRTKPIVLNGVQKGCKKIMVLYMTPENGGKAEKTNWVMHQYHLGTEEDEKDGEYVVSKVFYQQQQGKLGENDDQDVPETAETTIASVDLVTANSVTPEPPLVTPNFVDQETQHIPLIQPNLPRLEEWRLLDSHDDYEKLPEIDPLARETQINEDIDNIDLPLNLLDSQQLAETFSSYEDFFQSQSPKRHRENGEQKNQPSLSTYDHLGAEQLNKNMEECKNLDTDTGIVEIDSQPSDVRLSQLVFNSQDSYIAWGGNCIF